MDVIRWRSAITPRSPAFQLSNWRNSFRKTDPGKLRLRRRITRRRLFVKEEVRIRKASATAEAFVSGGDRIRAHPHARVFHGEPRVELMGAFSNVFTFSETPFASPLSFARTTHWVFRATGAAVAAAP